MKLLGLLKTSRCLIQSFLLGASAYTMLFTEVDLGEIPLPDHPENPNNTNLPLSSPMLSTRLPLRSELLILVLFYCSHHLLLPSLLLDNLRTFTTSRLMVYDPWWSDAWVFTEAFSLVEISLFSFHFRLYFPWKMAFFWDLHTLGFRNLAESRPHLGILNQRRYAFSLLIRTARPQASCQPSTHLRTSST